MLTFLKGDSCWYILTFTIWSWPEKSCLCLLCAYFIFCYWNTANGLRSNERWASDSWCWAPPSSGTHLVSETGCPQHRDLFLHRDSPCSPVFSPPADYLQVSSFAWITPEGSWQKFLGDTNCISQSNCSIYLGNKQTNKQIKITHTYIYTRREWTFLSCLLQNCSDEETLILSKQNPSPINQSTVT